MSKNDIKSVLNSHSKVKEITRDGTTDIKFNTVFSGPTIPADLVSDIYTASDVSDLLISYSNTNDIWKVTRKENDLIK